MPAKQLTQELLKITDWFTDELFGSHAGSSDTVVCFPVSRLVVDPERFVDDSKEPMASVGMGAIYTTSRSWDSDTVPFAVKNGGFLIIEFMLRLLPTAAPRAPLGAA